MYMKTFCLLILLVFCLNVRGQNPISFDQNYYDDSKGTVYYKEFNLDFQIHTNGGGIGLNIGEIKSYYLTRYYHFALGEIKHPKEYRKNDPQIFSRSAKSYIYGKQNNLFALRGGIGEKRYFSEKAKRNGVAVGVSYEGGISLGLLKPYYLDLIIVTNPGENQYVRRSEKYSPENEDLFIDPNYIYGGSGFAKGLNEITILPGGHFKAAVHFDWGAFDEFVKALEAGVMVDVFLKNAPILIESERLPNSENRQFFINLFLNLQFGKRW